METNKTDNNLKTNLNQLVDVLEDDVINKQMKDTVIRSSLKNKLLLLDNQLSKYQKEKLQVLEEKEQLERDFQNENALKKEVENDTDSTRQMVGALKELFSALKDDYEKKSNKLDQLKNFEEEIYNMRKLLREDYDVKKAKLVEEREVLAKIECENEELNLKSQKVHEKVNQLNDLYKDKGISYLNVKEEYEQELNRHQELLNCYETEKNLNEELKASLKSLCVEDLISERNKNQTENKLNLEANNKVLEDFSNSVTTLLEGKKKKELQINKILEKITETNRFIEEENNEISQLQTKITDCEKNIREINDNSDKIIFDLQKQIEYAQNRLNNTNQEIEDEKQLQETCVMSFKSDEDGKRELDELMEKQKQLKETLNNTNQLNVNKLEEIKKMQKRLRDKLTENNNLLLSLQKENMEAKIAEEQTEKQFQQAEQEDKKRKEEYEYKISVISNEISTFTEGYQKVEKERQEKLQQLKKQNLLELEKLKADYGSKNKKKAKVQLEINKKRLVLDNLKNRRERLSKEVKTIKDKAAKKPSDKKENKQPKTGIMKSTSRFPKKKVQFSVPPNDAHSSGTQRKSVQKSLSEYKSRDQLFDMLKDLE